MTKHHIPLFIRIRRAASGVGQWLADCGAAIVRPVERLFSWIGRRLLSVTERVQGVESVLLSLVRAFTWPFRALERLMGSLITRLLPSSLRHALAAPFRWLYVGQRRLVRGLIWLAEKLNLDVVFVWLMWLLKPIWYPVAAIGNFLIVWAATRRYKSLLWGLPALLLLLAILVPAAWGTIWGHGYVADHYRLALKEALKQNDYSRVELYERKLAQLGVDTNLTDFHTAEALERKGKLDEAYERMQRLAPTDKPGYAAAHFWIVQRLLVNKFNLPADEAQQLVNVHLKHLATLGIKGPEIDLLHAFALAQQNQLVEASKLLKPLVARIPLAAIQRMRIDIVLHDQDAAEQDSLAVREHMQSRVSKGLSLENDDYQGWAIAEEVLGNNARMKAVLTDWLKIDPKNPAARQDLGAVTLRELVEQLRAPSPDPKQLAARFREAFELSSNSDPLKQQVAAVYRRRTEIPELQTAFGILIKSADTPASLSETIGTAAALEGDWDTAQACLRHAIEKDPTSAVAWNNFACVLYQGKNPQMDQALAAANKAIELSPDEYRFRETRGQVYARLAQWQSAIADLEFALNGMPDAPAIHKSLVKAYEALGNKELAAAHRQYSN